MPKTTVTRGAKSVTLGILDFLTKSGATSKRKELVYWDAKQEGEGVRGIYLATRKGRLRPFAILESDTELIGVNINASLSDQLTPTLLGENICIVYKGDVDTGKGNPMKSFEVFHLPDDIDIVELDKQLNATLKSVVKK